VKFLVTFGEIWRQYPGIQLQKFSWQFLAALTIVKKNLIKIFGKMSETEANNDVVADQPTAEDLKGVKRAAEVTQFKLVSSIRSHLQNAGRCHIASIYVPSIKLLQSTLNYKLCIMINCYYVI